MSEQDVEKSSNIVVALMTTAIFVAVLVLVLVIVYGALGTSYDDYAGNTTTTVAVINETGALINTSGYSLASIADGNSAWVLTALWNSTDTISIELANATVSAGGVVTNATSEVWNNVSISYTYTDDITDASTLNVAYDGIQDNILSMATNFFALAPTIGTILAVLILIAVIVILVMYVSKMRNQGGSSNEAFSG